MNLYVLFKDLYECDKDGKIYIFSNINETEINTRKRLPQWQCRMTWLDVDVVTLVCVCVCLCILLHCISHRIWFVFLWFIVVRNLQWARYSLNNVFRDSEREISEFLWVWKLKQFSCISIKISLLHATIKGHILKKLHTNLSCENA